MNKYEVSIDRHVVYRTIVKATCPSDAYDEGQDQILGSFDDSEFIDTEELDIEVEPVDPRDLEPEKIWKDE